MLSVWNERKQQRVASLFTRVKTVCVFALYLRLALQETSWLVGQIPHKLIQGNLKSVFLGLAVKCKWHISSNQNTSFDSVLIIFFNRTFITTKVSFEAECLTSKVHTQNIWLFPAFFFLQNYLLSLAQRVHWVPTKAFFLWRRCWLKKSPVLWQTSSSSTDNKKKLCSQECRA